MPAFIIPDNFTYHKYNRRYYDFYNGYYQGAYTHFMGKYNSDIDIIFDGNHDDYWNLD